MQDLNTLLKRTTLKSTPQRLKILKTIQNYGHISIENIYEEVKNDFPSISLATVYKNINSLKEANILSEIHPQNTKSKYEIKKQSHGHFVCKICNIVYDFELKSSCNPDLDDIKQIEESEVYLYGICKNCN